MMDQALERDLRIAAACRTRVAAMHQEMQEALRSCEQAMRQADAFRDRFDSIAEDARRMRAGLATVERRLQRVGAYFVSEEQTAALLTTIADVGADEGKFCHWWGVDSIPEIAAHDFEAAKTALESKRTKVAA